MPRNLRGEIFAAALVLLLLLVVGLSAMLLSQVNNSGEATAVARVETVTIITATTRLKDTLEPIPTEEVTAEPTATETSEPSQTPSSVPSATDTLQPTQTPSVAPSATDTPEPTQTPSVAPSATDTPEPTQTPPVAPSATDTPEPTQTPTNTETATAAQLTRARTRVAARATETLTPTVKRPSSTPTPTVTVKRPTATDTFTPTATATLQPPSVTPTVEPCSQPAGWATYTVQRGNTLFSIARAVGSSVGVLRTVNCIPDANNIDVNQVLFVPRAPNGPVQTGVPRDVPDSTHISGLGVEGCTVPGSSLSAPVPGQRLSGLFEMRGTASLDNFQFYRLEVRPDFTNVYNFYSRSEQPVVNGRLGQINTELFDDGLYWVRLTVVDRTGNFVEPCAIPVIFE